MIGLFGIGEILTHHGGGPRIQGQARQHEPEGRAEDLGELPQYWTTLLRSAAVGCWMGITPGGATAASFMSYGLAKRFSRDGDNSAAARPEGVLAPETAAHAAGTSALLPMLTLGIPGSADGGRAARRPHDLGPGARAAAVRRAEGFRVGTDREHVLGNVAGLFIVLATVPLFAAIMRIPFSIIAPIIIVICAIGAYTVHNAMMDVWLMMFFGVVGYMFKKLEYPLAPLVLALVLGDRAEDSFRQTMLVSNGQVDIFWSNPLIAGMTGIALVLLFWPALVRLMPRARTSPVEREA